MTPLKPIENTMGVHGVMADRYPINEVCAHPECDKPTESVHHIFGRPRGPHSDSWFVEVPTGTYEEFRAATDPPPFGAGKPDLVKVIPHAIGLCGHGTAGHHGDVDSGMGGHQAWIKLEDGVFYWYDRMEGPNGEVTWNCLGALDPQPGGRQKVNGKKRKRKTVEERKTRRVISFSIPKEAQEDGGEIWDDLMGDGKDGRPYGRVRAALNEAFGDKADNPKAAGNRSPYYVLVDVLNDWLNS